MLENERGRNSHCPSLPHNLHTKNIICPLEQSTKTVVEEMLTLEYDEDYGWAVEERIYMDGIVLVDIHFILNSR